MHRDNRSFEASLGSFKRKYKLAGRSIRGLDQHHFFVTSSGDAAFHKDTTIKVESNEWLKPRLVFKTFFNNPCYIDLNRVEAYSSPEVLAKINDTSNRFLYVAELPQVRFDELVALGQSPQVQRISKGTRKLVVKALLPIPMDIIRKLGLD